MGISGEHATDEQLEQYGIGRLRGSELEAVEEHLLLCPLCQDRMTEMDEFLRAMRSAAASFQRRRASLPGVWRAAFTWPRLAWAAAALVALATLGIGWRTGRLTPAPPVAVALTSIRGPEGVSAAAPARRPLALSLDVNGVPEFARYGVRLVDATGQELWRSTAARTDGQAATLLAQGYGSGRYYLRLFSPSGEFLREYPLRIGER